MKTTISATIDSEIATQAKNFLKGEISSICEDALATALKAPAVKRKKTKFKGVPTKLICSATRSMEKSLLDGEGKQGKYAVFWANKINEKCGTRVTANDIINLVPRVM